MTLPLRRERVISSHLRQDLNSKTPAPTNCKTWNQNYIMKKVKLIFTFALATFLCTGMNVKAQGTYALAVGDLPTTGQEVTSVPHIKMIYGGAKDAYTAGTKTLTDKWTAAVDASTKAISTTFSAYTAGNGQNPTDDNNAGYSTTKRNVPTRGCFYEFCPDSDGVLTVAVSQLASKYLYLVDEKGVPADICPSGISVTAESCITYDFNVYGGKKYYLMQVSSKLGFFGFTYKIGGQTAPIEVENIGAFNKLKAAGCYKLNLSTALVTVKVGSNIYIQDGTGGLCLYNTGLNLSPNDIVTGSIYGSFVSYSGTPELVKGFLTDSSKYTVTRFGSASASYVNVANAKDSAFISKHIAVTKVRIVTPTEGVAKPAAYAVNGSDTIKIYDSFGVLGSTYKFPKYATSITGILGIYKGEFELFPEDSASIVSPSYANPLELCVNGDMSDISSWTVKSAWSKNTSGSYADISKPFMELWVSSGALADNYAYQIAKNLPEGLYILKAGIEATKQSDASAKTTGVKLYMNSDSITVSTANNAPELFTIKKVMAADSIKFGIDIKSTNANWIAWDNVSLIYYGDSATYETDKAIALAKASQDALAAEISAAQALSANTQMKNGKDDLNTAITAAQAVVKSTDMTALADALTALKSAENTYKRVNASYATPYTVNVINGDMSQAINVGWTSTMNKMQSNKNWAGGQFMESWKKGIIANAEAYQTITSLTAGLYIFQADVNSTGADVIKGVKLFINNDSTACSGSWKNYAVKCNMKSDGDAKIGLSINGTNSTWTSWDNATLTFYGDSATYENDKLNAAKDAYNLILDSVKEIISENKVPEMTEILEALTGDPLPTTGLYEYYTTQIDSLNYLIRLANGVISKNVTPAITNADGSNGVTGWTTNFVNASGERHDGKTTSYFDKWNGTTLDVSASQTVKYLPAGKYTLTVVNRGQPGSTGKFFANTDSVALKTVDNKGGEIWAAATAKVAAGTASKQDSAIAAINGNTGFGWSYDTIHVTLTEPCQELTFGFKGNINNTWMSFTDWTLTLDELITKDSIRVENDWVANTTNSLKGWTNDGFALGTWQPTAAGYVNGSASCVAPFIEKWTGNGTLPNATVQQTMTNLPNGEYEVTASFIATKQSDANTQVNGVWFFANGDSIEVATGNGVPQLYCMDVEVTDGTLNFGYKTRSTTANWVAFDNIELTYIGVGDTIINREKAIVAAGTYQGVTAALVNGAIKKTLENNATYQGQFNGLVALKAQLSSAGTDAAVLDSLIKLAQNYDKNSTVPANVTKDAIEAAITTAQDADVLDLPNAIKALQTAINTYITSGATPINGIYFDMTGLINNPKLETVATGWSETPSLGSNCSEMYNRTFDLNQTIENMPAGSYDLSVTAFHRQGFYTSGIETVAIDNTNLYANETPAPMKSLYYTTEGQVFTNGTGNYANSMADAQVVFDKGLYVNSVVFNTTEAGSIKIGIKNADTTEGNWTIFRDFSLKFWGAQKFVPTGVKTIAQPTTGKFNVYTVTGQTVRTNATNIKGLDKGLYIINGKTVVVK